MIASRVAGASIRGILYQLLLIGAVLALAAFLIDNTLANLAQRGIATGFAFLSREAGFQIGDRLISYAPDNSYRRAFLVGLLNTLLVAGTGIVATTILGTLIGIARLSSNWLIRKLASLYVETLRNVPLLLQLIVWWDLLRISAPDPHQAWQPIPGFFISNRGIAFPAPVRDPAYLWCLMALLIGILGAIVILRRRRRDMATERRGDFLLATGLVLGLPLLTFLLAGAPLHVERPVLERFNFAGGIVLSPEFATLVLGLSFYTASFVAEIVRGGILAVGRGQREAALALGLRQSQVLRFVILPQALRLIIPPMTSQYLNLTKNSSLAVYIGYREVTSIGYTTANQTGQSIESIGLIMTVYLTISLTISLAMNLYNRRIALVIR